MRGRTDSLAMLERTDVVAVAKNTEQQRRELVVDGRGIAFVCLEHFTGATNSQTEGLGLSRGANTRSRARAFAARVSQLSTRAAAQRLLAATHTCTREDCRLVMTFSLQKQTALVS